MSDYDASTLMVQYSRKIKDFVGWITGNGSEYGIALTATKYLNVMLVGMALAAAGASYKCIFRNVLAAPTTMGVQEGGILGNLLFIGIFTGTVAANTSSMSGVNLASLLTKYSFIQVYGQQIFMFVGCFVGVAIVSFVALTAGRGTLSSSTLILTGTVVNGAIAGITGAIQYQITTSAGDDSIIDLLMEMTLGTFRNSYRMQQFVITLICMLPCFIILFATADKMNIFALGDEEARGMGLNVRRFKLLIIILGVFMTAVTMVYCGHISYIGFIVPQIASRLVGNNFKKLLPASILLGGIILMLVEDVAERTGMTSALSVFTSFIGGIMLIYILFVKRGPVHEAVS